VTPDSRDELIVSVCFLVAAAAGVGLAVTYGLGGQTQVEGLLLGIALLGIGAGLILWSHRLLPLGPVVSEREELGSPPEVDREVMDDLQRGGLTRRKAISRTLGLALAALGAGLALPVRSLGPSPGRSLLETPWGGGRRRLITSDGRPVRADEVPTDGLVTVFPEGSPNSADGQAVLMRVDPKLIRPRPGREGWTPDGLVAYSKVCTHAGCPVGLYQPESHTLLCPCHQSTFDVLNGAKPLVGPAAVALPQLPLAIDGDGVVVGTGEFSDPVGPSFWHRT